AELKVSHTRVEAQVNSSQARYPELSSSVLRGRHTKIKFLVAPKLADIHGGKSRSNSLLLVGRARKIGMPTRRDRQRFRVHVADQQFKLQTMRQDHYALFRNKFVWILRQGFPSR